MPNNDITALRDHLFDVIERLKSRNDPNCDPQEKIEIEDAKAITEAAKIIVDSAKVEVEMLHIISRADDPKQIISMMSKTKFLPSKSPENES